MSNELEKLQSHNQELMGKLNQLTANKIALEQTLNDLMKTNTELKTNLILVGTKAKQLEEKITKKEEEEKIKADEALKKLKQQAEENK